MDKPLIRKLAVVGAKMRLVELDNERNALIELMNEEGSIREISNRRRRGMSRANRRAVSIRMKKYWAAKRREKASK